MTARASTQPPPPWATGARVGCYVVGEAIGRGAMGEVFRGEDIELARPVALKRLHAGTDADSRGKLANEARAAAQLQHPNAVAVYEIVDDGEHAERSRTDGAMLRLMIAGLCMLAACGHAKPRTGMLTDELIPHIAELGREGQAQIVTTTETGRARKPGEPINVPLDQLVRFRGTSTTLVLLLAGCPPFTGKVPCPIKRHDSELVYLLPTGIGTIDPDDYWTPPPPSDDTTPVRTIAGVLSLVSFGGMGLCIAYCSSHRAEKSLALGGAGGLFGIVWMLMSGNVHD